MLGLSAATLGLSGVLQSSQAIWKFLNHVGEQLQASRCLTQANWDPHEVLISLNFIGKLQVWQEVWQRILKAELANIPGIFQEYSNKLEAKPPISKIILGIFREYWLALPWGSSTTPPAISGAFL